MARLRRRVPADRRSEPGGDRALRTVHSSSEQETIALGEAIGRALRAGDVLALDGELGAGKTRLVRGIARGMGLDERLVSSPTFVIANHYPAPTAASLGLYHVDAYRLHGADELDSVGWDRVMAGPDPVVVEWADRLGDAAAWANGRPVARVRISHGSGGETRREFAIDAPDGWAIDPPSSSSRHVCPTCGTPVAEGAAAFPFCSDRCRLADLNKWFTGSFIISRDLTEADLDENGPPEEPSP